MTQSSETQTQKKPETQKETESQTPVVVDEQVEMISVLYKSVEDARVELEKLGFDIKVSKEEESNYAPGTILSQDIAQGTKVDKGTVLNVVVAKEEEEVVPEMADVPNVVGKTENVAVNSIKGAGLSFSKSYEYNDTVAAGTVISQNPQKNESVEKGTTVNIVISQGQESVIVPNVVNQTQSAAQIDLDNLGLRYDVRTEYSDTVEEGKVIKQNVLPGKKVAKGKTVKITVSLGKKTIYYNVSVTKAFDGEYPAESCTFVLTGSNGTTYSSGTHSGNEVTVTASDMTCNSGTLKIVWTYQIPNEDGTFTEQTAERTYDVPFSEQS